MRKPVQNIGASVRARLLNLAKQRNQPFELMLIRYTLERFLYRLSTSKHRERFALKGAMLMRHWLDDPHRPTRDLDLLGFGDSDPTEPGLNDIELPVLLDQPALNLRAYPYETVIAEKLQAMVALGLANSRLKDFYDIWILAQTCDFKDDRLAQAIAATFARRKTEIPTERPDGLTSAFASDPTKQQQWNGFVEEVAVNPGPLVDVVEALAAFLLPHAEKARNLHAKR